MIQIKSPGRICLFGEHQDYLFYPIISMAITKYIYLKAEMISSKKLLIELPDINDKIEIELNDKELEYYSKRDYLRSAYNQFLRKGIKFKRGFKIEITGDIPINAGVASSSALIMAWLYFLNLICEDKFKLDPFQLAMEGYNTEVKEFNEAGGMMDHFTSIYGNLVYLKPETPVPKFINKRCQLEGFVLGNSLEKKDTVEDLFKVKRLAIKSFEVLKEIVPNFNQYTTSIDELDQFLPNLKKEYQEKIIGNLKNRDLTIKAKNLIFNEKQTKNFYQELGTLLNLHQEQLKNNIKISTKKIDEMITNCLEKGALGAKINGSGFGGTMFSLFPKNENFLIEAIENAGGEAFIIKTSNGVKTY